jgi:hypothetical protein
VAAAAMALVLALFMALLVATAATTTALSGRYILECSHKTHSPLLKTILTDRVLVV